MVSMFCFDFYSQWLERVIGIETVVLESRDHVNDAAALAEAKASRERELIGNEMQVLRDEIVSLRETVSTLNELVDFQTTGTVQRKRPNRSSGKDPRKRSRLSAPAASTAMPGAGAGADSGSGSDE